MIVFNATLRNLGNVRLAASSLSEDMDIALTLFVAAELEVVKEALKAASPESDESHPNNDPGRNNNTIMRDYTADPHFKDQWFVEMIGPKMGFVGNSSDHAAMVLFGAHAHTIHAKNASVMHFFFKDEEEGFFESVEKKDQPPHEGLRVAQAAQAVAIRGAFSELSGRVLVSRFRRLQTPLRADGSID